MVDVLLWMASISIIVGSAGGLVFIILCIVRSLKKK